MTVDTTPIGPDGLPFEPDEPAVTAERASRMADELAALVDQLVDVLAWQDRALQLAGEETPAVVARLFDARRINRRARRSLSLVRDCLGEQHVECDQLAGQLRALQAYDYGHAGREGYERAAS